MPDNELARVEMSAAHDPFKEVKAGRQLRVWSRVLLGLLGMWAAIASVAAFLAVGANAQAHSTDWLGAWSTLFACAAVFVVARVALLWVAEDYADRTRRRQHQQQVAARKLRESRQLPREIKVD
jgi:hypothetical protein